MAFKCKEGLPGHEGKWYTGRIDSIREGAMRIEINIPIYPQMSSENDFTVAYLSDISDLKLLESA